jgi:hypothetical protein
MIVVEISPKELVEKCRILYKGDWWAGAFYLLLAVLFVFFACGLQLYTERIGWYFLSMGLYILFLFCLGKGLYIVIIAHKRKSIYEDLDELTPELLDEEIEYTRYRIEKKIRNRRRYVWVFVSASIIGTLGIFSTQKGFIIGSMVPIALIAGIEFGIGLLTEFRLWGYKRYLNKAAGIVEEEY